MFIRILIFISLFLSSCLFKKHEDQALRNLFPNSCKDGLYYGPNKLFAIYVFCDDASGTTIGLINTSPGAYAGPGSEKAWRLSSRFWQEPGFSCDVEYARWSSDGKKIVIRTGNTYGSGKTYSLDLINKQIEKEIAN
jgi:hypothetical protein